MTFKHPVLPYRAGVGILLADLYGNVLIGPGSEGEPASTWRMPEDAIGLGESEREAALRILHDCTGLCDARVLAEAPGWFTYELPCDEQGSGLGGLYCGQRLRWFAMRWVGDTDAARSGGALSRSAGWRWVEGAAVPVLAAACKRQLYEDVVATFAPLLLAPQSPAQVRPAESLRQS